MGGSSSAPVERHAAAATFGEYCDECGIGSTGCISITETNCYKRLCMRCASHHVLHDYPYCEPCLKENHDHPQEFWAICNRLLEVRSRLNYSENQIQKSQSLVATLKSQRAVLRKDRDAQIEHHATCVEELRRANEELEQMVESLQKKLRGAQTQKQQAQAALRGAQAEQQQLRQQIQSKNVLLANQLVKMEALRKTNPPADKTTLNEGTGFKFNSRRGRRRALAGKRVEKIVKNLE